MYASMLGAGKGKGKGRFRKRMRESDDDDDDDDASQNKKRQNVVRTNKAKLLLTNIRIVSKTLMYLAGIETTKRKIRHIQHIAAFGFDGFSIPRRTDCTNQG